MYRDPDGQYVAVGALEPAFYAELVRLLELPGRIVPDRDDPAQYAALRELLAERFAGRTQAEWQARLRRLRRLRLAGPVRGRRRRTTRT